MSNYEIDDQPNADYLRDGCQTPKVHPVPPGDKTKHLKGNATTLGFATERVHDGLTTLEISVK